MDEHLHDLLEDAAAEHVQRGDAADLARRARRRHRRRVGAAAVAGIVVATFGIGLTLSVLRFGESAPGASETPTVPTPSSAPPPAPAETLQRSWSVAIADTAIPSGVLVDSQRIVVPTRDGVVVYPLDCGDPCRPLWRGSIGAQRLRAEDVAAADGLVAIVDGGRGLFVFDEGCATEGATCAPAWSFDADPGVILSSPSIANGVVRVTTGRGEVPGQRVGVIAFPQDCASPCTPAWTADMGTGPIYVGVTELDGVGYQQAGMTMYGFASDCRTDGGVCEPDLKIGAGGSPTDQSSSLNGPVGDATQVVFSAGDGNVYAYTPHCGTSCTPTWVGRASDYLEGQPVLAGATVVVATGQGLVGFPFDCAATCLPSLTADLPGYSPVEYADGIGVIAASHFGKRQGVSAVPADCGSPCPDAWTAEIEGDVYGATADATSIFVGSAPGQLSVYPRECRDGCAPASTYPLDGESWWLFRQHDRLVVGARSGGATSIGLTLTVYEVT